MHFADDSRGRPFSKDPAVVRFQGRYLMYYSQPSVVGSPAQGWTIGIASSQDLENWTKAGEIQPADECEKNGVCAPGAIILDGCVHLFYQSYGNGPKDAICHAWSEDGIHFTRNATNPIFRPTGDWNVGRAIDADVIAHDGLLYLFFATRDPDFKIQMLGVASAPLDSGFERQAWTQRCDDTILKPELPWEQECIEAPALCRNDDKFFMFYGGAYNNKPQQIGCAVSTDLIHWQRISDEPFLPNGQPGEWNSSESGHPYAFQDDDGQTYLFFQGNNDMGKSWYLSQRRVEFVDGKPVLAD